MATYKRVVLTENEKENKIIEKRPSQTKKAETASQKQLDKFDSSYTSKKLNELYHEFDAITFASPSIASATITDTDIRIEAQSATAVSFRTKLYLTTAIAATLLLAFLAIYNILVINGINTSINSINGEISVTENSFRTVQERFRQLRDANNIANRVNNSGYSEVPSDAIRDIPLLEVNMPPNVPPSTNWFDQFVNFLGGVFGG